MPDLEFVRTDLDLPDVNKPADRAAMAQLAHHSYALIRRITWLEQCPYPAKIKLAFERDDELNPTTDFYAYPNQTPFVEAVRRPQEPNTYDIRAYLPPVYATQTIGMIAAEYTATFRPWEENMPGATVVMHRLGRVALKPTRNPSKRSQTHPGAGIKTLATALDALRVQRPMNGEYWWNITP